MQIAVELSAMPKPKAKSYPHLDDAFRHHEIMETSNDAYGQGGGQDDLLLEKDYYPLDLVRQQLEYEGLLHKACAYDFTESHEIDSDVSDLSSISPSPPFLGLNAVWQARLLLIFSAALYGTNFTFVKILNENMPVQIATSLRFALAAIVTLALVTVHSLVQKPKENDCSATGTNEDFSHNFQNDQAMGAIIGGFEVGLWNAVGFLFQATGLETTSASTSAFICSLAVVTVPILDFLAGKKILTRQIVGAMLAVLGVAFLELDGVQAAGEGMSKGDLFSLMQPIFFGLGFWRMEHYMRKFPTEAMTLTASQLAVIAMASTASFLISSGGELPDPGQLMIWLSNPTIVGAIVWTGLITTALTVYMETLALKTLSAAETTMVFSTEPIFGGACAAFVLGEKFGLGGVAGSVMVLGGCLWSGKDKQS